LYNVIAAAAQAAAGGIMMGTVDWFKTAPLYTNFPYAYGNRTIVNQRPDPHLLTSSSSTGALSVGAMAAVFLWFSALNHILSAIFLWDTYSTNVYKGRNPIRWCEYFFSASLMHVSISLLCGIFDVHLLFTIFALTATTMVFGWLQEAHGTTPEGETNWSFFLFGFVPHMANWAIILCYFFTSVSRGNPPDFVWSIIFVIFFIDSTFAVVALYHQCTKSPKSLYHRCFKTNGRAENGRAEVWYIVLSLTAKQALAWMQFWGMQGMDKR
jgi:hypothetical protein